MVSGLAICDGEAGHVQMAAFYLVTVGPVGLGMQKWQTRDICRECRERLYGLVLYGDWMREPLTALSAESPTGLLVAE